jgi:MscS family membrane protein
MDKTFWREFLQQEFLNNSVANYLWFAGILLIGFIFKTILSRILTSIIFRLLNKFSDPENLPAFRRLLIQPLEVLLFLIFLYFAFQVLDHPLNITEEVSDKEPFLKRFAFGTYQLFVIISITWIITRLVDFIGLIFQTRANKTSSKLDDQLVPFFKDFSKVMVVIFAFMVVLGAVFKVNVAGLIAGLGVGGLALAFAAKESLENLLASFTIFLDQPFVVGDLVEVDGITGTIEKIGFRSTRIRTLEKSFVTVPNKSMIDKPLNNLTLRTFRRVFFDLNLTYSTTSEQIKAITQDIQDFIDNHPHTNQDGRVRFSNLGASSKDVMVLYFVDTMDWHEYINIKEEIAFKIVSIVEAHSGEFAFPTTTVHLHQTESVVTEKRRPTFEPSSDLK